MAGGTSSGTSACCAGIWKARTAPSTTEMPSSSAARAKSKPRCRRQQQPTPAPAAPGRRRRCGRGAVRSMTWPAGSVSSSAGSELQQAHQAEVPGRAGEVVHLPAHATISICAAVTLARRATHSRMKLVLIFGPRWSLNAVDAAFVGLAAFVGHLWPVFFRFQGGKGVATAAGVLLALNPLAGRGHAGQLGDHRRVLPLFVAGVDRGRRVRALLPAADLGPGEGHRAGDRVMSVLLIWRHEGNIRKLHRRHRVAHRARRPPPPGTPGPG
jgi:hypothetical protein